MIQNFIYETRIFEKGLSPGFKLGYHTRRREFTAHPLNERIHPHIIEDCIKVLDKVVHEIKESTPFGKHLQKLFQCKVVERACSPEDFYDTPLCFSKRENRITINYQVGQSIESIDTLDRALEYSRVYTLLKKKPSFFFFDLRSACFISKNMQWKKGFLVVESSGNANIPHKVFYAHPDKSYSETILDASFNDFLKELELCYLLSEEPLFQALVFNPNRKATTNTANQISVLYKSRLNHFQFNSQEFTFSLPESSTAPDMIEEVKKQLDARTTHIKLAQMKVWVSTFGLRFEEERLLSWHDRHNTNSICCYNKQKSSSGELTGWELTFPRGKVRIRIDHFKDDFHSAKLKREAKLFCLALEELAPLYHFKKILVNDNTSFNISNPKHIYVQFLRDKLIFHYNKDKLEIDKCHPHQAVKAITPFLKAHFKERLEKTVHLIDEQQLEEWKSNPREGIAVLWSLEKIQILYWENTLFYIQLSDIISIDCDIKRTRNTQELLASLTSPNNSHLPIIYVSNKDSITNEEKIYFCLSKKKEHFQCWIYNDQTKTPFKVQSDIHTYIDYSSVVKKAQKRLEEIKVAIYEDTFVLNDESILRTKLGGFLSGFKRVSLCVDLISIGEVRWRIEDWKKIMMDHLLRNNEGTPLFISLKKERDAEIRAIKDNPDLQPSAIEEMIAHGTRYLQKGFFEVWPSCGTSEQTWQILTIIGMGAHLFCTIESSRNKKNSTLVQASNEYDKTMIKHLYTQFVLEAHNVELTDMKAVLRERPKELIEAVENKYLPQMAAECQKYIIEQGWMTSEHQFTRKGSIVLMLFEGVIRRKEWPTGVIFT